MQQIRSQLRVMLHSLGRTFTSCACGQSAPDCALALADAFVNGSLPIPAPHNPDLGPLVGKRRNFAARESGEKMGTAEEVELPREDVLPPKMRRRSVPTTHENEPTPSGAIPRVLGDITSAHNNTPRADEDLMPPPPAPPPKRSAATRRVSPNTQPAQKQNSRKRMKTSMTATMPSPEPYSPSTPFSHLSLVSPVAAPPSSVMGWPPSFQADGTPVDEDAPSISASTSTSSAGRAKKGKGRAKKEKKVDKEKDGGDGEEESVLPESPIMRRASVRGKKRKRPSTPEPEPEVEEKDKASEEMDVDGDAPTPEVRVDVEETPASPPPDVLAGDEAPASPASAPISPRDPSPPAVELTEPSPSPPSPQPQTQDSSPPVEDDQLPPKSKPTKRRVRIPQALRRVPASPEGTPEPTSTVSVSGSGEGGRDESEGLSSALTSPPNERMEMPAPKDDAHVEAPEEVGRSRSSSVPPLPTPPDANAMSPAWEVRESTPARDPTPPPPPREATPPPKEPTPPPPPPKVKLSLKDFKLRKMREREEQEQARAAAPPEPEPVAEADVEMGDTEGAKDEGMSVDVKAEALDGLEDTTMETDTTAVDEPAPPPAIEPAKPAFYVPPPPVWSRPSSPVNPPPKVVEKKIAEEPDVDHEVDYEVDEPPMAKVGSKVEEPEKVDNNPEEPLKVDSKPNTGLNGFAFSFRPPDVSPPSAPAAIRPYASSPPASTSTAVHGNGGTHASSPSASTSASVFGNGGSPPQPALSRSPTLTPHSPAASFSRSVTTPKDNSPIYSPAWTPPIPKPSVWANRPSKATSPSPVPTASLLARISSPPPPGRDHRDYSRSVSPAYAADSFSRARGRPALQAVQTNHRAAATPSATKDSPLHKDLPPHMSNANTTPLSHDRRFGAGSASSAPAADEVEDGEVPSDVPSTPTPVPPPPPRAPPTQPRAFQAIRTGVAPPSGPRALRLGLVGGVPRAPQAERVSDRGWGRGRPGSWSGRG